MKIHDCENQLQWRQLSIMDSHIPGNSSSGEQQSKRFQFMTSRTEIGHKTDMLYHMNFPSVIMLPDKLVCIP